MCKRKWLSNLYCCCACTQFHLFFLYVIIHLAISTCFQIIHYSQSHAIKSLHNNLGFDYRKRSTHVHSSVFSQLLELTSRLITGIWTTPVSVFVCLFGVCRSIWEFFTHMETSPLPVKGCKCRPMLNTYGNWSVRVLKRATPTVTRGIRL